MTILTLTIMTTIYFKPRITRILRISECRRKFAFNSKKQKVGVKTESLALILSARQKL